MRKNTISRRNFLRRSTAPLAAMVAAPYVITSTALGTSTIPPASERVTIAHIGVGGQGSGLLSNFLGIAECQSVAVCDCFQSRREERARQIDEHYASRANKASYKGCRTFHDFRELLACRDIDGVVVATPDHWHVPIALAAARAGKDMYVEKPLGISLEWNKALRDAVNRYGVIFQYGTQQRSSYPCRFGCELVRNGRIGKVHTLHVIAPSGLAGGSTKPVPVPEGFDYDMWLGPAPWSPYTVDRCTSEGTWHVYDNALGFIAGWGAHPLDIAQWGNKSDHTSPVEYEGTGTIPTEGLFNTLTNWQVRCRYADGVEMTFTDGPNDMTRFLGTEGWVNVWRGGLDAEPKSLLKSAIRPEEEHLVASDLHAQNFVDCMRSRAQTLNPIESAIRSDAISHLSDIAIRTGRKIKWDPVLEVIVGDSEAARMTDRPMREPWLL